MKKEQLKEEIKNLLKDGPKLAATCLSYLKDNFDLKPTNPTLTKAKKELNITSHQSAARLWYWYDPSVKMTRRDITKWLDENTSKEIVEENEIEKEMENCSKSEDPYVYLDENSLYYFDHEDDFTLLPGFTEEWGKALRRKPQRIETFKQLSDLDPNNLPSMLDIDGNEDEALKWIILEFGWIEEAKILIKKTKDKKYKTQVRELEKESRDHREAFKEYWGYDAFPSYDYGIQPSNC